MNTLGISQTSWRRRNEARRDPADTAELSSNGVSGEAFEAMVGGTAPRAAAALKKEFQDWFGKSLATNPDGSPAVVYRGEHGRPPKNQFHSRLNSLSFSADPAAASTYAMQPNVYKDIARAPRVSPAHLKIEKPIIKNLNDPFIHLAHLEKELGVKEAMRIAKKFSSDIEYTGNWDENYVGKYASVADLLKRHPQELKKLYFAAFKYLDDPKEVALLRKNGYDGAIHVGNGETSTSTEYRVFDLSQVRSAIKGFALGGDPA
jgi:hypothetical protein